MERKTHALSQRTDTNKHRKTVNQPDCFEPFSTLSVNLVTWSWTFVGEISLSRSKPTFAAPCGSESVLYAQLVGDEKRRNTQPRTHKEMYDSAQGRVDTDKSSQYDE